jgi:TolA-binding protein
MLRALAKVGTLCLVCALLIAAGGCREKDRGEQALFLNGRALVTQGRYQQAIPVLERYLAEFSGGSYASRAGLFLGKSHLGLDDLEAAELAFQQTLRNYPQSLEAHKSRYKLALIALLRGDRDDALRRFGELADAPDGPLAPEAAAVRRHLQRPDEAR